jgi:hypothetical protein
MGKNNKNQSLNDWIMNRDNSCEQCGSGLDVQSYEPNNLNANAQEFEWERINLCGPCREEEEHGV